MDPNFSTPHLTTVLHSALTTYLTALRKEQSLHEAGLPRQGKDIETAEDFERRGGEEERIAAVELLLGLEERITTLVERWVSRGEEINLGTAGQDLIGEIETAAGLRLELVDNRISEQQRKIEHEEPYINTLTGEWIYPDTAGPSHDCSSPTSDGFGEIHTPKTEPEDPNDVIPDLLEDIDNLIDLNCFTPRTEQISNDMKSYLKHLMPPLIPPTGSGSKPRSRSQSRSRSQISSQKKPEVRPKQKSRIESSQPSSQKNKLHSSRPRTSRAKVESSSSSSGSELSSDELTAQRLQAEWDHENDLLQSQLRFARNLEHRSHSPSQFELDRLEAQRLQAQIEEEQAESDARRAARLERETEEAIRIAAEWENEDSHAAALQREWEEQDRRLGEQEDFARILLRRDEERATSLEGDLAAAQAAQAQWEQEVQEQENQARRATKDEERREGEARKRRATAEAAEAEQKSKLEKERAARKEAEKKVRVETERLQRQQAEKKAKLDREQRANEEAAKKIQLEARKKEKLRVEDAKNAREMAEKEKQRVTDAKKARELLEKEKKARQADCVSCMEAGEKAKMCVLSCEHAYCEECIGGAFQAALSSKTRFKCCKLNVPVNVASSWLDATFIASYKMLILEQATKDPRYCSNKECTKFIPPANIHGAIAICQTCKHRTCAPCGNGEHSGVCKEDKEGQVLQALAEKEGWRNCPSAYSSGVGNARVSGMTSFWAPVAGHVSACKFAVSIQL
ncbi:hypothetical protein SBOR_3538 [Sclerotinia borealis F-4128]|uniref:IBR domain-containing protein n=1 Tax=Sclerotinia borealis (strain F-4128) TaxID=1432307 RepID=W9CJL3_SCLBF|nr:hypothetical protein SBOR_3538 [Sclerotinia borealis F-4128]